MDQLKFGVIGAGFMGDLLAEGACALPYARCVGAADVDENRAQALVARRGGTAYRDLEQLIVRERPDVVFVATPEPYHLQPVLAAVAWDCHLFVEKPLASTLEDADAIIAASRAAGVKLMTGYNLRFEPDYALIQQALAEGAVGPFLSAYARRNASILEARRLGGRISPIVYLAVHDIDQFLWYHPVDVASVSAHGLKGRVWEELGVYDYAWITIQFVDGALATAECGWGLPEAWNAWQRPTCWGGFGDVRMHVIGRDGVLEMNMTPMDLYACDREGFKLPDTRHRSRLNGKLVGSVKTEVEHFMESVLYDRPPAVTGEDGRKSLQIALAAEQSIREERPIQFLPELIT